MAGIVYIKLIDALKGIGVDVSQQQASNVKKLAPKNKSTATKPGLLAAERDTGGNFATVLDVFKNEAKYIDSMNDAEQMAFLNNILDYNEFGGKSIGVSKGIEATDAMKDFEKTQSELKKALDDLNTDKSEIGKSVEELNALAKNLKDETTKNKNKALEDLDTFLETGGQPLKKKDDKFLGGSMHEEGQLRTGIRQFLQTEYKNGRLKLDKLDAERVMEYSPMSEHDPILVFKKIYGDEAYKKAGSFPGAFEIGENFKHYEEIFRNNMGEDILKVKDKKYVGDGKLVLTKQEEVFEPTPDDDDIPFAKGGRASFAGGKLVSEFIALIVKKEPIEAMKEVNKVIGKKGKYKNLTQKDIDKIVADTEDHIFQRDPDNLYVYDDGKTIYDDDMSKKELIEKEGRKYDQEQFNKDVEEAGGMEKFLDENPISADDMTVEESLTTMEGLGATQTAERFRLKQKYPGIDDTLVTNIINDTDPNNKARVLAILDEAMLLGKSGKSSEEIVEIIKSTPKKEMATGGRAGFYMGGQSGQSVIEPDLSDIGHGSDALMSRTRMLGPNTQATTSTGLNYLLGEDNDNTRVPFRFGGKGPGKVLQDEKKLKQMMENFLIKRAPFGILTPSPKNLNIENLKTADRPPEPEFKIGPYDPQSDINPFSKDNVVEFDDGTFMYKDSGRYFKVDEEDEPYEVPGPSKGAKIKPIEMEAAEGGRAGFNDGLLVPPAKPYTEDMFEKDSMTLLKGMYGTGPESNPLFYNKIIEKGNILRNQGVERETIIEIIRNNKDKINAFLETQTQTPKNFKGLESFQMKANGGRIGFQDGLNFDKAIAKILEQETKEDVNMLEEGEKKLVEKMSEFMPNETQKEKEEREMFQMVKEFQTLKKNGRIKPDLSFRNFQKMKTLTNLKNKILELNVKYPEKKIINDEGMVNTENLKSAIDEAEANLEISPIDGLKLKRSINTEGEQSVTSGSFDIGNLNFSSDNIEEGKLTSRGDFTFGDLDLSGMINSNDGKILNTELGFDYGNKTLEGKMYDSDGYRSAELDLNKTFPLTDKINLNLKGNLDTSTYNNKTNTSSDLTPKLSYNDGLFNVGVAKSILEGGDTPNLSAGVNYNNFYLKGDNLLSEKDRSGIFGYQKEFGNQDGNLFFTAGAEKNIYDDDYTIGAGLKLKYADGGVAGLRPGYAGGTLVDKGRRGFLKLLGATAGGVAALKLGLGKMLGKESGAVSKKVIDEVIIEGGSGAPAWLQPLVNKALREGMDKTKGLAYKDAQVVKSLDTPTGKVDVYYDVRTGEVEIDYIGGNTALGESVNMRYTPGIADEGTKGKPADEFEATEAIPEYQGGNPLDGPSLEVGENITSDVKGLYSDTSELAELGGEKLLIKDISETIKKKKTLNKMQENPADFITDEVGIYDPT